MSWSTDSMAPSHRKPRGLGAPGYLGEREHVEVRDVVFVGALDALLALLGVDHLAHVLRHKVTLEENNMFSMCI